MAAPAITHEHLTLLVEKRRPFAAPGWVFELKYDGWRCMVSQVDGKARLVTRWGTNITEAFPEVATEVARLPDLVADGELVILDGQGRPQFYRLSSRASRRSRLGVERAARSEPAALFLF